MTIKARGTRRANTRCQAVMHKSIARRTAPVVAPRALNASVDDRAPSLKIRMEREIAAVERREDPHGVSPAVGGPDPF
jgi:hypothetical protein